MNNFTSDKFYESDCYCSLTAINIDYPKFIAYFGECEFSNFSSKLANAGFDFLGIHRNSAIFSFPSPVREELREEIDEILEDEILLS